MTVKKFFFLNIYSRLLVNCLMDTFHCLAIMTVGLSNSKFFISETSNTHNNSLLGVLTSKTPNNYLKQLSSTHNVKICF